MLYTFKYEMNFDERFELFIAEWNYEILDFGAVDQDRAFRNCHISSRTLPIMKTSISIANFKIWFSSIARLQHGCIVVFLQ